MQRCRCGDAIAYRYFQAGTVDGKWPGCVRVAQLMCGGAQAQEFLDGMCCRMCTHRNAETASCMIQVIICLMREYPIGQGLPMIVDYLPSVSCLRQPAMRNHAAGKAPLAARSK